MRCILCGQAEGLGDPMKQGREEQASSDGVSAEQHYEGSAKLEISKGSLRALNQGRPVILKVITEHRVV